MFSELNISLKNIPIRHPLKQASDPPLLYSVNCLYAFDLQRIHTNCNNYNTFLKYKVLTYVFIYS